MSVMSIHSWIFDYTVLARDKEIDRQRGGKRGGGAQNGQFEKRRPSAHKFATKAI